MAKKFPVCVKIHGRCRFHLGAGIYDDFNLFGNSFRHTKMFATVDDKQEAPNYRTYIAAGITHTILASSTFYTENSAGVSLLDWINAMLDGGVWENVECTECGAPAVCPY